MERIKNKILKTIKTIRCNHEFERFAFYYFKKKELKRCVKCGKVIEIQH
jgi:hypothetical protein